MDHRCCEEPDRFEGANYSARSNHVDGSERCMGPNHRTGTYRCEHPGVVSQVVAIWMRSAGWTTVPTVAISPASLVRKQFDTNGLDRCAPNRATVPSTTRSRSRRYLSIDRRTIGVGRSATVDIAGSDDRIENGRLIDPESAIDRIRTTRKVFTRIYVSLAGVIPDSVRSSRRFDRRIESHRSKPPTGAAEKYRIYSGNRKFYPSVTIGF